MDHEPVAPPSPASLDPRFEEVWRTDRGRMVGLARRTLGDAAEAEDVVQEAFGRLARVDLDELEDVSGWLAVVVRRLCLDRIRSADFRHESVTLGALPDGVISLPPELAADPADRITLDDQVQLALAVVLDRLSPRNALRSSCTTSSGFRTQPSARSSDARRPRAVSSRAARDVGSGRVRTGDASRSVAPTSRTSSTAPCRNDSSRRARAATSARSWRSSIRTSSGRRRSSASGRADVGRTAGHRATAPRPVRPRHRQRAHPDDRGAAARRHRVRAPACGRGGAIRSRRRSDPRHPRARPATRPVADAVSGAGPRCGVGGRRAELARVRGRMRRRGGGQPSSSASTSPMIFVAWCAGSGSPPSASATSDANASTDGTPPTRTWRSASPAACGSSSDSTAGATA